MAKKGEGFRKNQPLTDPSHDTVGRPHAHVLPEAPLPHLFVFDKDYLVLEIKQGNKSAATSLSQTTASSVSSEIRQMWLAPQNTNPHSLLALGLVYEHQRVRCVGTGGILLVQPIWALHKPYLMKSLHIF